MDTITHALSGALVVQTLYVNRHVNRYAPQSLPLEKCAELNKQLSYVWLVLKGFLAGAFPDADAISGYFGTTAYLNYHRGITHSIFMVPIWAGLLANRDVWLMLCVHSCGLQP